MTSKCYRTNDQCIFNSKAAYHIPVFKLFLMAWVDWSGNRCRSHITPVLQQLHWLLVQRRVEFKIACLVRSPLASTAPTYLSADIQLISEHGHSHLRSSSHRTLVVPRTHASLGGRSFTAAGPHLWKALRSTLHQITSYGQFRQRQKTHLFRASKSRRIVTFDYLCHTNTYLLIETW